MRRRAIDVYDMYMAVENHFNDNEDLWNPFIPIKTAKIELSEKISALATQVALQLTNSTGITADKENVRMLLESQAFKLSAAISGYANVMGRSELYNRCHYSKSTLKGFRDAEIIGIGTNLLADCTLELANLASYGVRNGDLEDFGTTLSNFGAIMKNPTEAIAKRKTATDKIEVMIADTSDFLLKRMDNLMVMMENEAPAFVESYHNLRAIHNTGSRHLSLTITTLDAATNKPIAHVNLEIVRENIKRISSARGYNTVINLVEGRHDIQATHPNYITKTESFTVVNGETTELVLLLQRV